MVSKLLVPGKTTFTNVPTESEDVKTMVKILEVLGLSCKTDKETLEIENHGILKNITIPDKLASKTRYSSLLLGALGAFGCDFRIPLPGGCHMKKSEKKKQMVNDILQNFHVHTKLIKQPIFL